MILPDVNVLVEAFRPDAPHHRKCREWLLEIVNGENAYGIAPQALSSLIRIATHNTIYSRPSALEEVLLFAKTLLSQPHCHVVQPGPSHWELFTDLCRKSQARGNLVPDAWFAWLRMDHL